MKQQEFPIEEIRSLFPALTIKDHEQVSPIYFDGPGGTQMAQPCIDRMLEYITTGMANLHGTFSTSIKTDRLLEEAREAVANLLNCAPEEVAFGQNMTSLAFQVAQSLRTFISEGDEIVVTQLDHRANVDPWLYLAKETGAVVKFLPVDKETLTHDLSELDKIITSKTKLVAIGLASNLTGTITDAESIFSKARTVGAFTIADAVHAVPHIPVDFKKMNCDILFCSAYKFFGPHLGIAVIKSELFEKLPVPKLQPAPDEIPYRLETGTQNHEGIAGLCGAIGFIEQLGDGENAAERIRSGMERLESYEQELSEEMESFLKAIPEVELFRASEKIRKTPTFAFRIKNINSREATRFFAEKYNLCIGDGHFYASTMAEVFPVMDTGGWIRIGFAPYNSLDEIEIFKKALKDLLLMKS
ncbi:cysteine desulfurase family protein, VC1184 subfamily [Salinimicrobium catena]|uniref:Cysteine desulfurase family protein, VC1184 subfamily n=1 Tax=Salinimicrobium catena TaxID=390640 RepID=A0A1H5NV14_9FLAO|nr:cysteine desulfurase-like protein [Salinimicrobium catena]SDL61485.1 cysteine desulfurase family protein, VC1184 subfamily [Salinimicrobium catena]SEF05224.1 cysteine desulfurase family protein, VC1184 subfamily [Salinimicrobium catena]